MALNNKFLSNVLCGTIWYVKYLNTQTNTLQISKKYCLIILNKLFYVEQLKFLNISVWWVFTSARWSWPLIMSTRTHIIFFSCFIHTKLLDNILLHYMCSINHLWVVYKTILNLLTCKFTNYIFPLLPNLHIMRTF